MTGAADLGEFHPGEIRGRLYAFPAACPKASGCGPLWTSPTLRGADAPLVQDGRVFAPSNSGLFVFAVNCRTDGGVCSPLWHAGADIHGNLSNYMDRPAVAGRDVFITTEGDVGGGDANPAALLAYPVACRSDGGRCSPRTNIQIGNFRWTSPPLVHKGSVVVPSPGHSLIEYTDCAHGLPGCRFHRRFGAPDARASSARPIAVGDRFVMLSGKGLFGPARSIAVFDASCPRARCRPLSTFEVKRHLGDLLIKAEGFVFSSARDTVVAIDPNDAHHGVLHAAWHWTIPDDGHPSQFAVSDKALYVATNHELYSVPLPARLR